MFLFGGGFYSTRAIDNRFSKRWEWVMKTKIDLDHAFFENQCHYSFYANLVSIHSTKKLIRF